MNAEVITADLATEMKALVREAGERGGGTIKRQMNRAAEVLGYERGHWRIKEAWYGEAGSWSAVAIEELRRKHALWKEKTERRAREKVADQISLLLQIRQSLLQIDPDFHCEQIARIDEQLDALGHAPRTVAAE